MSNSCLGHCTLCICATLYLKAPFLHSAAAHSNSWMREAGHAFIRSFVAGGIEFSEANDLGHCGQDTKGNPGW